MTLVIDPTAPPEGEAPAPPQPAAPPRLAVVLGTVGRALILAGIVVLLFVVFQLWGTDLQESRAQDDLRGDLETRFDDISTQFSALSIAAPATAPPSASGSTDATPADPDDDPVIAAGGDTDVVLATPAPDEVDEALALLFPDEGDALAKIEIPSLEVDKVVVRGVAVADLRRGPGHYSQTALPGNPGNASIAGHRTTYGSPFNRIDELVPGDEIVVTSVQGEFVYRVLDPTEAYADAPGAIDEVGDGHIIVHPTATWVLDDFGDDRLTLTACHPKLSSRQRIIVAAELVAAPVVVPDWAVQAQAEREALTDDGGAPAPNRPSGPDGDGAAATDTSQTVSSSGTAAEAVDGPDLDEGLNGERDAILPGLIWLMAAVLLWYAGGRLGRRFGQRPAGRAVYRLAGLVPAMVCLWFSFELIDRALPAG